jgi:Protein of unknown function (DUF3037)
MPSRYSIVQYVPDLVSDERINVGVLVFEGNQVRSHFLRDWRRVRSFGGQDVGFLRKFARQVEDLGDPQIKIEMDVDALTAEMLEGAPERWANSIQLTPLRASTLPADELLEQTSRRFLRERVPATRGRDRRAAASLASRHLLEAVRGQGARKPELYVKRNLKVDGSLEDHHLDVALKNGKLRLGVLGLSFEARSPADVLKEISATAWTIDDVRNAIKIPMAVIALLPKSRSKSYDRAERVFTGLGATLVPEDEISDWAKDAARDAHVVRAGSR